MTCDPPGRKSLSRGARDRHWQVNARTLVHGWIPESHATFGVTKMSRHTGHLQRGFLHFPKSRIALRQYYQGRIGAGCMAKSDDPTRGTRTRHSVALVGP